MAAVSAHNFEQCSKEKLNKHLHLSSNSVLVQDKMDATEKTIKKHLLILLATLPKLLYIQIANALNTILHSNKSLTIP